MLPPDWVHTLPAQIGIVGGALLIEAAFGYPDAVFRAVGHPVIWMGWLIGKLDRSLNAETATFEVRRAAGILSVLVLLAVVIGASMGLEYALRLMLGRAAWMALAVCASTLLAQRSLYSHVAAVRTGLSKEGLAGGRAAVAHIVGRNPLTLDEAAVIRAAIESLAENFSDGVVAPAIWGVLGGLPGIAAYKAINTADSMIGHRTPRHAAFGWAAARLDDVVNLPGSRLATVWIVLAACLLRGASPVRAMRAVLRDARHHRSPNAGWPEAAMAGALGLRLAGPRVYGQTRVDDAWMGDGRAEAGIEDLTRALALFRVACAIQIAAVVAAWALIARG